MTAPAKRKAILLAAAVVLGLAVAADRLTPSKNDGEDSAGPSPREAYLIQAAAAERQRALLAEEGRIRAALDDTREQWNSARARMVAAPSAELAAARLRDMVEAAMRDHGLRLVASSALPPRAPIEGEGVRIIGLSLDFDAPNPDVAHRVIDRLENLPEAITNIARLRMDGPGAAGGPGGLHISIEVHALAWIGEDA